MDALQGILPDTWFVWLTSIVTVCAALASVLPAPAEKGSAVYRCAYKLIQWVGFNLGRAKNAQDAPTGLSLPNGKR